MTATYFLAFLAATVVTLTILIFRYFPRRAALRLTAGLAAWLTYVGALSYFGIVADAGLRPPGAVFLVGPVFLFVFLVVARSPAGARAAQMLPLWLLIGFQTYRVGVEYFLHRLWLDGLAPRLLTYEGANLDIIFGVSAPVTAWLATRGSPGLKTALAWNILGILSLANIAGRAVLTAPGPLNLIHSEVPNRVIGTFPFTYVPGFFAALALVLHVLSIRHVLGKLRLSTSDGGNAFN